jgi:Flp pilus assembly protein TadG
MIARTSSSQRGTSLVEFALVSWILLMLVFGIIEFSRMVLVYTTLGNASSVAVRYAVVHGSDVNATPATTTDVCNVFKNYAFGLNISNLACGGTSGARVMVTWPDAGVSPCSADGKTAGCRVKVAVFYPYDPFLSVLPLTVNLGASAQGVIEY